MIMQANSRTTLGRGYLGANEYPFQPFVKRAVAEHFAREGFQVEASGDTSLVAHKGSNAPRWVIEVLGKGKKPRTDWALGLSDIVMTMQDEDASILYALAVPATRNLQEKRRKVGPWVRRALRLHWLVVHGDGSVSVIGPEDKVQL